VDFLRILGVFFFWVLDFGGLSSQFSHCQDYSDNGWLLYLAFQVSVLFYVCTNPYRALLFKTSKALLNIDAYISFCKIVKM
jgi:hypothetical protein